jgi:hypothetical protein
MKKADKPTATKKAAKKAPKKLKRKAELAALVEQFTTIADRLERCVDRLAPAAIRQSHSHHDNDDLEIGRRDE